MELGAKGSLQLGDACQASQATTIMAMDLRADDNGKLLSNVTDKDLITDEGAIKFQKFGVYKIVFAEDDTVEKFVHNASNKEATPKDVTMNRDWDLLDNHSEEKARVEKGSGTQNILAVFKENGVSLTKTHLKAKSDAWQKYVDKAVGIIEDAKKKTGGKEQVKVTGWRQDARDKQKQEMVKKAQEGMAQKADLRGKRRRLSLNKSNAGEDDEPVATESVAGGEGGSTPSRAPASADAGTEADANTEANDDDDDDDEA